MCVFFVWLVSHGERELSYMMSVPNFHPNVNAMEDAHIAFLRLLLLIDLTSELAS